MKTTLLIKGMHCHACVQRLTQQFEQVHLVSSARVSLSPPSAEIESEQPIPIDSLAAAARKAGDYSVELTSADHQDGQPNAHDAKEPKPSLYPLVLIVSYILGTAALVTHLRAAGSWHSFMYDFMAGFFLVFSFFKLLDLRGFADAYQSYDILAQRFRPWAIAYPFVELALGIAYLSRWQLAFINSMTMALMLLGSIGVLRALLRKNRIRCACLGTALNLPMTTVTLIEDLGMAAMALFMILWK